MQHVTLQHWIISVNLLSITSQDAEIEKVMKIFARTTNSEIVVVK